MNKPLSRPKIIECRCGYTNTGRHVCKGCGQSLYPLPAPQQQVVKTQRKAA